MPNPLLLFFYSRKTAFIGILMIIMKQCVNTENSLNNDFDYKSSSITNEGSSNNYPIEFLSSEENKNPGNRDEYYSITNPEISESNSYSTFKSEFSEDESSSQKIRKRDDDEASADNEEESDLESDENGEELMPESDGNDELKTESSKNDELKTESSKNVELKPELGENRKFNPKSSENEEALNPESSENEEALAPESSDNEEALKSESDENEKESKPEPSKGGTFLGFGKPPISSPNDNEEVLPPPLSQNSSFPESDEEKNGKAEESVSISTSNLEESLILPTIGEGGIDYSDETYAFHSKPVPSDFSWQTGKSRTSGKRRGKGPAAAAARAKEFRPEDNWDEDSFYPRSFPRAWKLQKAKTVKPPQPMVSWNEFLVMQDKFQKNKLNPKLAPNNQLSLFHKSKDNLYNFVKDAIKRNKQIEKELMKLKKMLEKNTAEPKKSSQFDSSPRIINNTLQLSIPLQQKGRLFPQEFKIKIEAEAPLKIKTQVGDRKDDESRVNNKPIRLEERSSEDSNTTSIIKIQVREISISTKLPDMLIISSIPVSSSTFMTTTTRSTETEDYDPLKAERIAFIRKGAEFLRRAWYKYKQKRHPFLQ